MKEYGKTSAIELVQNGSAHENRGYTVLVSIQNREQFDMLLPLAIDIATKRQGKVILLNIIEIPYQLPPSVAKKFILEREFFLMPGKEMLKGAECWGSSAIRIAHNTGKAIKRFAKHKNVNIIVRDFNQAANSNTIFDWLRESFKS